MVAYIDLGDSLEDERIRSIGAATMNTPSGQKRRKIAFITDDEPGKADRYIEKLKHNFPGIKVIERFDGPVPNTITVKVVDGRPCNHIWHTNGLVDECERCGELRA